MLVAMHHCHRNLLGLTVDVKVEVDAFAGADAVFYFMLRNESAVDRCDVEVRLGTRGRFAAGGSSRRRAASRPAVTRKPCSPFPSRIAACAAGANSSCARRYPFGWFRAWTYVHAPLTAFVAPSPRGDAAAAHCDGGGRRSGAHRVAGR